jgi:hypothetical protein
MRTEAQLRRLPRRPGHPQGLTHPTVYNWLFSNPSRGPLSDSSVRANTLSCNSRSLKYILRRVYHFYSPVAAAGIEPYTNGGTVLSSDGNL